VRVPVCPRERNFPARGSRNTPGRLAGLCREVDRAEWYRPVPEEWALRPEGAAQGRPNGRPYVVVLPRNEDQSTPFACGCNWRLQTAPGRRLSAP
jgi:hypothetical protein